MLSDVTRVMQSAPVLKPRVNIKKITRTHGGHQQIEYDDATRHQNRDRRCFQRALFNSTQKLYLLFRFVYDIHVC